MIRVGFHPIGGPSWMGGRSYLWNLFHALSLVEAPRVRPVLVCSADDGRELLLPNVERYTRRGPLDAGLAHAAGNLAALLGCNHIDQLWLRRARVDLFSHGVAPLGARASLPWIYMIHDLQHRRRPDLFSPLRRWEREWMFRTALDHASAVLVSSAAVRHDLLAAYGRDAERVRVVPDVAAPRVAPGSLASLDELARTLGVPRRYVFLPNQFWKHKNHELVVEALALAVRHEPELTVLATGAAHDPRHPGHYAQVMSRVRALGLSGRFRHLGLLSHAQVMALMKHAVAVVNPSWFEGRSLTVGEAISLGKQVLLSDIDAHREQAPPRARFHSPADPEALAVLLVEAWRAFDSLAEAAAADAAQRSLVPRARAFGEAYEALVLGVAPR